MKMIKPTILALVCGLLIATTHTQLMSKINANQEYFEQRLLREMVGSDQFERDGDNWIVRDGDQILSTIAPITTTQGYNGNIDLLVAYGPDRKIINVRVTNHRETPGIGDGIELIVSDWILGMNGRSLDGDNLVMALDGLTGATITSDAVKTAVTEVIAR